MADAPVILPLEKSSFFADGSGSRPLPFGVVAHGSPLPRGPVATGRPAPGSSEWLTRFPMKVDMAFMERGRERFQIFCAICHDPLGTGHGIIVERGYARPPSYHQQRLREAPVGYLFDVISVGRGAMPSYATQIPPEDRWAIVAYLRSLQRSQYAPTSSLADTDRKELTASPVPNAPGNEEGNR